MRVAKKSKGAKAAGKIDSSLTPVKNGETTLFTTERVAKEIQYMPQETYDMLNKALGVQGYGSCKPAEQLRIFKKYVPVLMGLQKMTSQSLIAANKNVNRAYESTNERAGKRWDDDEDNALIELASDESNTIMQIAITMGRSPGAIQSRISYLVGIRKLSQAIAGRFIGTINGEHVAGVIDGELRKG